MAYLVELLSTYGIGAVAIAVSGAYIFRDWTHTNRQNQQIRELEKEMREMLIEVAANSSRVNERATQAIQQNSRVIENLVKGK